MNATHQQLASLALWMRLTTKEAIALPAVIEKFAKVVGSTTGHIVRMCQEKEEVRNEAARLCRVVMAAE